MGTPRGQLELLPGSGLLPRRRKSRRDFDDWTDDDLIALAKRCGDEVNVRRSARWSLEGWLAGEPISDPRDAK